MGYQWVHIMPSWPTDPGGVEAARPPGSQIQIHHLFTPCPLKIVSFSACVRTGASLGSSKRGAQWSFQIPLRPDIVSDWSFCHFMNVILLSLRLEGQESKTSLLVRAGAGGLVTETEFLMIGHQGLGHMDT